MEHFYALLPKAKVVISLLLWMSCCPSSAQNLSGFWDEITTRIRQEEYLRIAGSMQLELRFNAVQGLTPRADAFALRGGANLLLDIVGVKVPLAAAFSDGDLTYRLPAYAFVGVSPSYRWITLHLGDRTMNFSPYTLAGHSFRGVGLELKPGKFYFAAMSGRLQRARAEDAGAIQDIEGAYRRGGWGIKTGFDNGQHQFMVILFQAKDDPNSIEFPDSSRVAPQENLILGLQGKSRIGKHVSVELDLAKSALTRDSRSPETSDAIRGFSKRMFGLYTPRYSSGYHNATKFKVNFTPEIGAFHLTYERIDPGYRTLGTLFFNNDQENISVGAQLPLFGKKVRLAANGGLQRNGLQGDVASTFRRFIGSIDLSATISPKFQVNVACSNITSTNRYRLVTVPVIQVDSIVLLQTNLSLQAGATYLGGSEQNSVFNAIFTYQTAQAIENEEVRPDQSNVFYMGMLSHTWRTSGNNWAISTSGLAHFTRTHDFEQWLLGPALSISKFLLKEQLRIGLSGACSLIHTAGNFDGRVLDLRSEGTYTLSKRQSIAVRASGVWSDAGSAFPFFDWNAALSYRLIFK
ncbi:MAG: hypothetical protein SH848_04865 [Saprospiraceae bacterium]|nr:hypothetical protein [Saprospiraceae bacterium]MDZ4703236.1 hypothetical protein [Saprospiraceae bacterium]